MDRDEATTALQEYLGGLDDAALKRVRDAPADQWARWNYVDWEGCRCLLGHAEDWRLDRHGSQSPGVWPSVAGRCPGENAFHRLYELDGLPRTVASIRLLATTLLREREITLLTAFCPLAAREEAGV